MKWIPVVALALTLVGCVGVPSGNEARAKQHIEHIDNALLTGDFPLAMSMTETVAGSLDFSVFYQLLHDESTLALREHYITELIKYAQPDGSTARIYFALDSADRLRLHRVLQSDGQLSDVKISIDALAATGNRSGAAPFLLSDNFSDLPSLQTKQQMEVVFERSVQVLGQHPDAKDALMVPVMEYALEKGEQSSEFQSVAAVLGKLNITRQDKLRLVKRFRPDIVANLFPKVVVIKDYSIPETQLKYLLDFELKDSESARFRNVSASRGDAELHICGQVNAKNSYGGYIGYRPFYIRQNNGETSVLMDAEKDYQATEQCVEHQLFP